MNSRRCFCVAALLSLCVHGCVFGMLALVFLQPRHTPPMLILVYGDSDREGLPIEVVALDPGVFRQGDARTAGGDNAPKSVDPKPAAVESPPAVKPPEDKPKPMPMPPEKPTPTPAPPEKPKPVEPPKLVVVDKPAPAPVVKPTPEPPKPVVVDKPAPVVSPAPEPARLPASEQKIVQTAPPTSTKPPSTVSSPTAGSGLPGASGGARLPLGTPSTGGTVGSPQGVRMVGKGKPTYPPAAREAGQEGIVYIRLRISAEGEVLDAWIHKSSGYRLLDRAALSWARQQQYHPARQGNDPVEAEDTLPVKFYLY